jgi:hypothetical protein
MIGLLCVESHIYIVSRHIMRFEGGTLLLVHSRKLLWIRS